MELWWQTAGVSMVLVGLAEIGDKSQLVCMALAARHGRAQPVLFGALAAFSLLNGLAVLFGSAIAAWLPQSWILAAMAVLFAGFGLHSLLHVESESDEETEISGHNLFLTAFMMIFLAELGDKTQIAVAGLAGIYDAFAVWTGATVALALASGIGVLVGKTVLRRLPLIWLHRLAGMLFLSLSVLAVWRLVEIISI
jgi:putative Ca2+/H+ antiporter (TMEM165/GDT1 family)